MTRAPFLIHEFAVPTTKRVRSDEKRESLAPGTEPLEHREDETLLGSNTRPWLLTLQNVKFLAKDEDLNVLRA
jgi:hypothetical protein